MPLPRSVSRTRKPSRPGQHQVEHDEVVRPAARPRSPTSPSSATSAMVALVLEVGPEPVGEVAVVLHDQDAGHGASTDRRRSRRRGVSSRARRPAARPRTAPRRRRPLSTRHSPPCAADQLAHHRQPDPAARHRAALGDQADERLPDPLPIAPTGRRDRASSTSSRASGSLAEPSAQDHGPAVAAVLERVVEQVEQDLVQRVRRPPRPARSRPARCGAAPPRRPPAARTARRSPGPAARAASALRMHRAPSAARRARTGARSPPGGPAGGPPGR